MPGYTDFLSETVALGTSESSRSLKIHKGLLADKGKPLFVAFDRNFKEGNTGVYVCQDTSESTLARFIEWAYIGDYTVEVFDPTKPKNGDQTDTPTEEAILLNNLFSHFQVYAFAEIYGIDDLKVISYEKLIASFIRMGFPHCEHEKDTVIKVLQLAFDQVPQSDPLFRFLANYVGWSIHHLRMHERFNNLLTRTPGLAVVLWANIDPYPVLPWAKEQIKGGASALSSEMPTLPQISTTEFRGRGFAELPRAGF